MWLLAVSLATLVTGCASESTSNQQASPDAPQLSEPCASDWETNFISQFKSNPLQLTQLVAASARYPGDSGNYFSCTFDYSAQFCTIISPPYQLVIGNNSFPNTLGISVNKSVNVSFTGAVKTGLCVPKGCNVTDIKTLAAYFYFPVLMDRIVDIKNLSDVTCLSSHTLHGAGAIITVIILIVLALLVVVGTVHRQLTHAKLAKPKTANDINSDESKPLMSEVKLNNAGQMESAQKPKQPKYWQLIDSFDLIENFKDLTKSPSINPGLKALDGLRVCSMVCTLDDFHDASSCQMC